MKFETYPLAEYDTAPAPRFPSELPVAFAVCSRSCGNKEFIIDGQTQVCQRCGNLMYRTEVRTYRFELTAHFQCPPPNC